MLRGGDPPDGWDQLIEASNNPELAIRPEDLLGNKEG
jgi:hypothetical protein